MADSTTWIFLAIAMCCIWGGATIRVPLITTELCPETCKSCSTFRISTRHDKDCFSCITGYYLITYRCRQCPTGCSECTSPSYCTACNAGYNRTNNLCQRCQTGCSDCKDYGSCYGCKDPYYGTHCEHDCPARCQPIGGASRCSVDSGHCLGDCLSGYYGQKCDTECTMNCHNNVCGKNGRSCLLGCAPGYKGSGCAEVAEDESSNTATIAGSAVGGIAVIAVAVVLTALILTKYRRSDRGGVQGRPATQVEEIPRNIYYDLNMTDLPFTDRHYDVLNEEARNNRN